MVLNIYVLGMLIILEIFGQHYQHLIIIVNGDEIGWHNFSNRCSIQMVFLVTSETVIYAAYVED